jgi:ubiquinone/menaquinone biosynthesis C-methylase UbiE
MGTLETGTGQAAPLMEEAVGRRYSAAATAREGALCCPVEYDQNYLEAIPDEVVERDYGCGDPSRYLRSGDTVVDLGSGAGKICFIASQIVGAGGRVVGVDMNQEMLALAGRAAPVVAKAVGYSNVSFRRGRIQDLRLDMDALEEWLEHNPVKDAGGLLAMEAEAERLRVEKPLIADASVDVVVSNCVLNLVGDGDKEALIRELFRVLKVGGRIAVSDIVSDETVPDHLKADPELWSGCISGVFQEQELLERLERAGFYGMKVDKWEERPFAVVEGIEFRSVTVTAHKGLEGPCLEAKQAVIYRGPWKKVEDDDGHVLERGKRTAVCAKTYDILNSEPYAADSIAVAPREPVAANQREVFDCRRARERDPRETKGADYDATEMPGNGSSLPGCC